jgi:transposase-like protein
MPTETIPETTEMQQGITTVPETAQRMRNKPVTDDKAAVIAMLRTEGMKTKAIAETLGISASTVYQAEHYLKKSGKKPLLSPKRIKNAVRVLDTFMQGKPIGRVEETDPDTGDKKVVEPGVYPKCSTIKACADAVLDREYPKVQEQQGGPSISFTKIDLTVYQQGSN